MNERIKELFQEAYSHFNKTPSYFTQELLIEKFAELLVKECALTAGLMEHSGRTGIGAVLLDKYGVKE